MNLTPQAMAKEVAQTGFGAEPLEKVFRLMALLDALGSHPFLKPRIALKGGTALNLFHFQVPRLSASPCSPPVVARRDVATGLP